MDLSTMEPRGPGSCAGKRSLHKCVLSIHLRYNGYPKMTEHEAWSGDGFVRRSEVGKVMVTEGEEG